MVSVSAQSGMAYLGILFLVAAISVSLGVVSQNEDTQLRREKELDWLFIGKQYQKAIASYYDQSPNGLKEFPTSIEDLQLDKRFIVPVRHLRKPYRDPVNSNQDWELVKNQEDKIIGVYSVSLEPILSTKVSAEYSDSIEDKGESNQAGKSVHK